MSGLFNERNFSHFRSLLNLKNINEHNLHDNVKASVDYLFHLNRGVRKAFICEMVAGEFLSDYETLTEWQKIISMIFMLMTFQEAQQDCLLPIFNKLINNTYGSVENARKLVGNKIFIIILDMLRLYFEHDQALDYHHEKILQQLDLFDCSGFEEYRKRHLEKGLHLTTHLFSRNRKVGYILGLFGAIKGNKKLSDFCFKSLRYIRATVERFPDAVEFVSSNLPQVDKEKFRSRLNIAIAEEVSISLNFLTPRCAIRQKISCPYEKYTKNKRMLLELNNHVSAPDVGRIDEALLLLIAIAALDESVQLNELIQKQLTNSLNTISERLQTIINLPFVMLFIYANQSPLSAYITSDRHPASTHCKEQTTWPAMERAATWQQIHLMNFKTMTVDDAKRKSFGEKFISQKKDIAPRSRLYQTEGYFRRLFQVNNFDFQLQATLNFIEIPTSGRSRRNELMLIVEFCRDELNRQLSKLRHTTGERIDPAEQAIVIDAIQKVYRCCCIIDLLFNHEEVVPYKLKFNGFEADLTIICGTIPTLRSFNNTVAQMVAPHDVRFESDVFKFDITLKSYHPTAKSPLFNPAKKTKPIVVLESVAKRMRIEADNPTDFDRKHAELLTMYEGYKDKYPTTKGGPLANAAISSADMKIQVGIFAHKMSKVLDFSSKSYQGLLSKIELLMSGVERYVTKGLLYDIAVPTNKMFSSIFICNAFKLSDIEKKLIDNASAIIQALYKKANINLLLKNEVLSICPTDADYIEKLNNHFKSRLRINELKRCFIDSKGVGFVEKADYLLWSTTFAELNHLSKEVDENHEVLKLLKGGIELLYR